MSYAIIRNVNYKKENLAGLYKHVERKNTHYSNKNINKTKSANNYSIKKCNTTYSKSINNLIKQYNMQNRITSYSNLLCEFIITSDNEFFKEIGDEETKRFFKVAYEFVANYKNLGEDFIVSAKIHMDEATPHMHIVFVPVIHKKDKNGNVITKIACSEYWKGKDSYQKLQDSFYKHITENGFNLERGKSRDIEHLSTEKLKQVTNYENIKYELDQKIQPLNTQNTSLILAQNQQLVVYVNKLKKSLAKSYIAIQKSERLQRENDELRSENQKLHNENKVLKNYLNKAFDVVKYLFDFPRDSFIRILEKFVRNFEKF